MVCRVRIILNMSWIVSGYVPFTISSTSVWTSRNLTARTSTPSMTVVVAMILLPILIITTLSLSYLYLNLMSDDGLAMSLETYSVRGRPFSSLRIYSTYYMSRQHQGH